MRQTIAKRLRAERVETKEALKRMRHLPVPEQGRWLGPVVRGDLADRAVPTNARKITSFHPFVVWHFRRMALATRTVAPKPEGRGVAGAAGPDRGAPVATRQDRPSLAAAPLSRQIPEVGAECVGSACSDLSGGRRVKPASLPGWRADPPTELPLRAHRLDVTTTDRCGRAFDTTLAFEVVDEMPQLK